jgi:hypothetical protein
MTKIAHSHYCRGPRGLAWFTIALTVAGCAARGPQRWDLSGQVTYNGKPLPAGVILFDPDVTRGNDGPGGFANVKDGTYDTRKEGRGVIGGPHLVRIQGFDGKPGAELPLGNVIFAEYTIAADLPRQAGTFDFDVPAVRKTN